MTSITKTALCALYKYSGVMRAQEAMARWSGQSFMSILLFHRVTDAIPPDGLTVGKDYFRRICGMLKKKFHVVTLEEIFRLLRTGERPPARTVAITFDDCYQDNAEAAKVLAHYGLRACFFVPTDFVGTEHRFPWDQHLPALPNLTWDDLRAMTALGHEVGSHTASHPDLGQVDEANTRRELVESKNKLEAELDRPARWFAFPFGGRAHFRADHLPLVSEAGYLGCVSATSGFVVPRLHPLILPRVPVPALPNLLHLELYLTGCLNWVHSVKRKVGSLATY